jgi:Fe-Mn family superoxide dismutase
MKRPQHVSSSGEEGGTATASRREPPKERAASRRPLRPGKHEPVPLPFDASKLAGISEKLITSHWENNYGAAVKNLNKVEQLLWETTKDTPPFVVGGLEEHELLYSNSMILHEHYFANLGGDGRPGGAVTTAISDAFGGMARWEEMFRRTGMSLAGASGWTVLDLNFHTGRLGTYWSGNHTQALAFGQPLLVLDMYEHAYQMDYGADAASYVDAFFENVNWDEVQRRWERALRALKALHGSRQRVPWAIRAQYGA